jgi:hypothetical protein
MGWRWSMLRSMRPRAERRVLVCIFLICLVLFYPSIGFVDSIVVILLSAEPAALQSAPNAAFQALERGGQEEKQAKRPLRRAKKPAGGPQIWSREER